MTVGTNCTRHNARPGNLADEGFDELLDKLVRETPESLTVLLTNDPAVRDQLLEAVTREDACQRIDECLGNRTINTDWLNALLTFVPSELLTKWLQSEGDTMALDFKAAVIAALIEVPLVNNTPLDSELRGHIESLSNGGGIARLVYCKYGDADQAGFPEALVACLQDAALSDRDIKGLVLVRDELLKSIDLDSLGLPDERQQVIIDAMNQVDRKKGSDN